MQFHSFSHIHVEDSYIFNAFHRVNTSFLLHQLDTDTSQNMSNILSGFYLKITIVSVPQIKL